MIDIAYFKTKILKKKDGPIVRFLDSKGQTVRLEDGYRHPKNENVIHKTHYWGIFDKETIKEIEALYDLRAVIS